MNDRRTHPNIDTHHLLFTRRNWEYGYARALRDAFTRRIPVRIHQELHAKLDGVPVPDGELCRIAWEEYLRDKKKIDSYGVARAAAWLYVHIPDVAFRRAMQIQINFFATH